ncbi:MAG TPA: hypothetical protein VHO06_07010 [Polyangia bacterium]|nr:hypothetical protein [Polyangia bacterium]
MFRAVSAVLGFGLILLWIAGLASHAVAWLTWLDGLAGLVAVAMGLGFVRAAQMGVPGWGLLAFGLFVLWIIGLAGGRTLWQAWWTFGFACAFLILAASATSAPSAGGRLHQRTT